MVSPSNGTDILTKGDESNYGLTYFKQAAKNYPGFCSTANMDRNIIEFAIFVGHANQETMKYPAVAEMIDGSPSLNSFYGKGVHQITYANNYIESTMSTKNLNGEWDPLLQNMFNQDLGAAGLYGDVYKGQVNCNTDPCTVPSSVSSTAAWDACVNNTPYTITCQNGNDIGCSSQGKGWGADVGTAQRALPPYGVSVNICRDVNAPATNPVVFWEVGIAYAMNRIIKSTTSNIDSTFYNGKWEYATEHNIIQNPDFFPSINSQVVGQMLAETTKVINGTVECSGRQQDQHIGRYCGFMNGLNALLELPQYSINWTPADAVSEYIKDCENSPSKTYTSIQTICTSNTRSGGGIPNSINLTWTNFDNTNTDPNNTDTNTDPNNTDTNTDPNTTPKPTPTPTPTNTDNECKSKVSQVSDEWCQAVGCAAAYSDFCTTVSGNNSDTSGNNAPENVTYMDTGPGTMKWNHSKGWCDIANINYTPATTIDEYIDLYKQGGECESYEGQKAGGWESCPNGCSNDTEGTAQIPAQDPPSIRKDVEGCCWWGRGAIQTTGPCNFGKLNYALTNKRWNGWTTGQSDIGGSYQGYTRTKDEGENFHVDCNASPVGCASYTTDPGTPTYDFNLCRNPELICSDQYPELKWIAGLFYWINEPQKYINSNDSNWSNTTVGQNWKNNIDTFLSTGNSNNFIDPISKIVNRGDTQTNTLSGGAHRRQCFETVLTELEFPTGINYNSSTRDGKVTEIINYLNNSNLGKTSCGSSTNHGVFCYDTGTGWEPSTVYTASSFVVGLESALRNGFLGENFDIGDSLDYALASISAFLAQCMHETIQYNACDENNWSINLNMRDGDYPASAACGQLNQDYQGYHCTEEDMKYECPGDFQMATLASTNAKWYGAPGPLFCAPNTKLGLPESTNPIEYKSIPEVLQKNN